MTERRKDKKNPHGLILFDRKKRDTLNSVERLDRDGRFYRLDYRADYGAFPIRFPVELFKLIKHSGCACFSGEDPSGEPIVGRNYDLGHLDAEKNPTGLNAAFTLTPEKGYRSVNFADAAWISFLKLPYYAGALDDGRTKLMPLLLLPYLTMDGMNEKGFFAAILALDVRPGEKPVEQREKGRKRTVVTMLLRELLDHAADVPEAIGIVKDLNVVHTLGHDYHLMIADAEGRSAVLEWRYDRLKVTETDAATNFYVGFDDAADCYWGDELKEAFHGPADVKKTYHYGYGHGYDRFDTIVRTLDGFPRHDGKAVFDAAEAKALLQSTAQDYTGGLTSLTQYSAVYHLKKRTVSVFLRDKNGDFDETFEFDIR